MALSLSLLFERGPFVQLSACTEAPINLQHVYSVLPESERRKLDGGGRESGERGAWHHDSTSIDDPIEEVRLEETLSTC